MIKARGYIASGSFRGNRIPQHIQNRIIRSYCTSEQLTYVLSRAEYNFTSPCFSQLWAAVNDGYSDIVFYSMWQLPCDNQTRRRLFRIAIEKKIKLHFACEDLRLSTIAEAGDLELIFSLGSIAYEEDAKVGLCE